MEEQKILLADIIVGDRRRKKFENIEMLSASLIRFGLLHPVVIDQNNVLVAGERRIRAAKLAGWKEIEFKRKSDLSESELRALELEENLQREEMTWQEIADGYQELHRMYREMADNPSSWTIEQTAERVGKSKSSLVQYLKLADAKRIGLDGVEECTTYKGALAAIDKAQERALMREIGKRASAKMKKESPEAVFDLISGDCCEVIKGIPDSSIHLILTDPIWGIDIASQGRFETTNVHFDDSPEYLSRMIPILTKEFFRVLVEDAHVYIFAAEQFLHIWKTSLAEAGFRVRPSSLIWTKDGGSLNDIDVNFMPSYEHIIFAAKGARAFTDREAHSDVFPCPRPGKEQRIVSTQKPIALLQKLVTISSTPGEIVLDPMCGSGTTIAAAVSRERRGIGIDVDPAMLELSQFIINATLKGDFV